VSDREEVLVVPTAVLREAGLFQGFSRRIEHYLPRLLDPAQLSYRPRGQVEDDPSFKQIIPYVLIRHQNRFLLAQRTSRQTEKRLHNKYSVGIGGHINDLEQSAGHKDVIHAGLERELNEEVRVLGGRRSLDLVGIISDDSTEVGKVHLGLVFILEVDSDQYSIEEPDLMTAQWAGVEVLREKLPLMETWSQIAFQNVIERALATK